MKRFQPFILLTLVAGCAAGEAPAPVGAADRLAPWTVALRASQPEEAYAAVYRRGRYRLVFIAARHSNRDDSPTFRLIRQAFAGFAFDTVIAEGFPTSFGASPERILRHVSENGARANGFVPGGETVPTVLGARDEGATFWGGEPEDREVRARATAAGISDEDLLGFYVLRLIPQWIREQRIDHAGDARLRPLVAGALALQREHLELSPAVLPGPEAWAAWYRSRNGQPLGRDFSTEEVGPLADGPYATNRIALAVARARGSFLHDLIVRHLAAGEKVLVVYGHSHLAIHRPALDHVLGPPCYVGADLATAARRCG